MNPPPPTEEAVKAAFALADAMNPVRYTYADLCKAQAAIQPFVGDQELCHEATARILAAHARAQQERAQNAERLCIAAKDCMLANDSDSIVASCNCLVMTPEIKHHKKGCKYRLITERNAWRGIAERLGDALGWAEHQFGDGDFDKLEDRQMFLSIGPALSELAKLKEKTTPKPDNQP